jgi:hypothetical protein
MAQSSILGGSAAPARPRGTGTDLLGPSDSSDSGSDVQGERALSTQADDGGQGAVPAELDSDTDARGTGERGAATGMEPRDGGDILPDRVMRPGDDALEHDDLDEAENLTLDDIDEPGDDSRDDTRDGPSDPRH